jgi:hypothetical protein
VTRPVVEAAGAHLAFEAIGSVRLKGFRDATELFSPRSRVGGRRPAAGRPQGSLDDPRGPLEGLVAQPANRECFAVKP